MNLITLLLLVSSFLPLPVNVTLQDPDYIEWNEFYRLSWNDFQGQPMEGSLGDAGAVVAIKAKPFFVKRKVKYDVVALFSKKKSWASDKSEALLAHEQLHFDIAELYARKIRKRIAALAERDVNDIKEYNREIETILAESNEVDRQYDIETLHGVLKDKQQEWQDTVRKELHELNKYKKGKRIIGSGD